ncbi:hypothetical protein A9J41_12630 [Laribacter hongkongensis]|uniref:hypothetical protein n=1 Tax=Laribacter hongkongensis TaxID=168471 RepID=UPI001877CAAD|nr:hypothetical protein [Laribacter hongkongensis]MBE5528353.1 hypothetical protein [Laribacter hongkongensis]
MNTLKRAAELLQNSAEEIEAPDGLSICVGIDAWNEFFEALASELECMAQADTIAVAGRSAVKLLREMEWENNRFADACPVCASGREQGHAVDCKLAAVLAGPEVTPGLYATPQHSSQSGWKLVPVEPTSKMIVAGAEADPQFFTHAQFVYRAMLAAVPEQEGGA